MACCLAVLAFPAEADIIFSNFGPGQTYEGTSYTVQTSVYVAAPFVPAGHDYTLSQIDLPLGRSGGLDSLTVELTADSSDSPGTILESWVLSGLGPFPNTDPPLSASSVLHPLLHQNTRYWLVALATDPSTIAAWNLNVTVDRGTVAFSYDGGGSWVLTPPSAEVPAFDVVGSAVTAIPEPGPDAMLLVVVAGCALYFRRHRRAGHENFISQSAEFMT
jgi:hypothetical protein